MLGDFKLHCRRGQGAADQLRVLSLPDLRAAREPPATRMKALEQEVPALLHAAQKERKIAMDKGRADTEFQVGDQGMLRT